MRRVPPGRVDGEPLIEIVDAGVEQGDVALAVILQDREHANVALEYVDPSEP